MLSYYGAKNRIAHLYPKPKYPLIIEPFAGGAGYSFLHWQKEVWLNELNPKIYRLWKWLIEEAEENEIRMLPRLQKGQRISSIPLIREEMRTLLSLYANKGSGGAGNHDVVTLFGASSVKNSRLEIARNLHKIKHWKVSGIDYKNLDADIEATWFIDPPYNNAAGRRYEFSRIDFKHLADWCRSRKGQVIVCENDGATWLPFKGFHVFKGTKGKVTIEAMWTNEDNK